MEVSPSVIPATVSFVYNGDGNRVQATVGLSTRVYIGDHAEWRNGTLTKYYYAGGERVAMREGSGQAKWLLGDHLGSTSITANSTGGKLGEMRYKAWGKTRYAWGTTSTTFRFTGQRQEPDLGLYFYNARWYDPNLGRFIQPDTIIPEPGNPLAFDRYAYVYNNPVRYATQLDTVLSALALRPLQRLLIGARQLGMF